MSLSGGFRSFEALFELCIRVTGNVRSRSLENHHCARYKSDFIKFSPKV